MNNKIIEQRHIDKNDLIRKGLLNETAYEFSINDEIIMPKSAQRRTAIPQGE